MKITFLGTGTSQGIPVIGCKCEVCNSLDYRDKRLRVSIHIEIDGKSFIIDSGPDFRQQVLRERIDKLDALIITHEHKDHTAGLDEVRSFNFKQGQTMPVYTSARVIDQLKREYAYVFSNLSYPGIPRIEFHQIDPGNPGFEIEGVKFQPIEVMHHKLPVIALRIQNFTYITDANYISEKELEKVKGSEVIVLNALQKEKHISHFTLQQAVDLLQLLKPQKAYLVHMSHNLGLHQKISKELPDFIELAYDGLQLKIDY